MYTESFLIIFDYFRTLKGKRPVIFYEWGIPLIITIFFCIYNWCNFEIENIAEFKSSALNIIGILLALSIAVITILITGGTKGIEEIKNIETETKIDNKKISLFKLLLINYSYSIIIELLIILFCLLGYLFKSINFCYWFSFFSYALLCYFSIHILLFSVRNITNLYFILFKDA